MIGIHHHFGVVGVLIALITLPFLASIPAIIGSYFFFADVLGLSVVQGLLFTLLLFSPALVIIIIAILSFAGYSIVEYARSRISRIRRKR